MISLPCEYYVNLYFYEYKSAMKPENKRFVSSIKYYNEYSTLDISYIYLPLSCESLSLQHGNSSKIERVFKSKNERISITGTINVVVNVLI